MIPVATRSIAGRTAALLGLLITAGALMGFAGAALSWPRRLPVLSLAVQYDGRWPVNDGLTVDKQRLESLTDTTAAVIPLADADSMAGGFWGDADEAIRQAFRHGGEDQPLIVYLNGHGVVDDRGQPCLVPPRGRLTDSATWLPLESLRQRIDLAQPGRPRAVLLILESGRIDELWPAGIADNGFAAAVTNWVARQRDSRRRLAVLQSVSAGQIAGGSLAGRGSGFTRMVVEAMRGAADGWGTARSPSMADGIVQLDELGHYVTEMTDRWSRAIWHRSQTPTLARVGDWSTVAVSRASLGGLPPDSEALESSKSTGDRVDALLLALTICDSIDRDGLLAIDPAAAARLTRLRAAAITATIASGGSGGSAVKNLQTHTRSVQTRIAHGSHLDGDRVDRRVLAAAIEIWQAVQTEPTLAVATAAVQTRGGGSVPPAPMLAAWTRQPELAIWQDAETLGTLAATEVRWLRCIQSLPDAMFPGAGRPIELVAQSRREVADKAFLGPIDDAVTSYQWTADQTRRRLTRWAHLDRIVRRAVADWPTDRRLVHLLPASTFGPGSAGRLQREIIDADRLADSLARRTDAWSAEELRPLQSFATRWLRWRGELDRIIDTQPLRPADAVFAATMRMPGPAAVATLTREIERQTTAEVDEHWRGGEFASAVPTERFADGQLLADWLIESKPATSDPAAIRQHLRQWTDAATGDRPAWRRAVGVVDDASIDASGVAMADRCRAARLFATASLSLDDFWGPSTPGGEPVFSIAAQAYLRAAGQTPPAELVDRLRDRQLAAGQTGLLTAIGRAQIDAPPRQWVQVGTKLTRGKLPPGTGAVRLVDVVQSAPVAMPIGRVGTAPVLDDDGRTGRRVRMTFRGHDFESPVEMARPLAITRLPKIENGPTTLRVVRDAADSGSLCFVLDCSASMADPAGAVVENRTDVDALGSSKLAAATGALSTLMQRLAGGTKDVGLVLYGHRMAQGDVATGVLLQQRYHRRFPFPPTLSPFADVELAMPVGRFGESEMSIARERLAAVLPWGQTPLFLAIDRAIDAASAGRIRDGSMSSADVIVISDGVNYQFQPTPDAIRTPDELIEKAIRQSVAVHVIGFGIPPADQAVAAEQFGEIALATGGRAIADIAEAHELLDALNRITDPEVSVSFDGQTATGTLGEPLTINLSQINTPVDVRVADATASCIVSPGDQWTLRLDHGGRQLRGVPDDRDRPLMAAVTHLEATSLPVVARLHRPRRPATEHQTVQMSLQHADGSAPARPFWFVTAVTPSVEAETRTYTTTDAAWLTGRSSPVATWDCLAWPPDAAGYRVEAWIAWHRGDDAIDWTLPETGQIGRVPGLPGVEAQTAADGDDLRLTIRSRKDSMIAVRSADDRWRVTRSWCDTDSGVSHHVLTRVGDPAAMPRVWLRPVESIRRDGGKVDFMVPASSR